MKYRVVVGVLALLIAASIASPAARAQTAEAASPAGRWVLAVEGGSAPAFLEVEVDEQRPEKIAGRIGFLASPQQINGEFVAGKLTFEFQEVGPANESVVVSFSGSLQQDGTLKGTTTAKPLAPTPRSWVAVRGWTGDSMSKLIELSPALKQDLLRYLEKAK